MFLPESPEAPEHDDDKGDGDGEEIHHEDVSDNDVGMDNVAANVAAPSAVAAPSGSMDAVAVPSGSMDASHQDQRRRSEKKHPCLADESHRIGVLGCTLRKYTRSSGASIQYFWEATLPNLI